MGQGHIDHGFQKNVLVEQVVHIRGDGLFSIHHWIPFITALWNFYRLLATLYFLISLATFGILYTLWSI